MNYKQPIITGALIAQWIQSKRNPYFVNRISCSRWTRTNKMFVYKCTPNAHGQHAIKELVMKVMTFVYQFFQSVYIRTHNIFFANAFLLVFPSFGNSIFFTVIPLASFRDDLASLWTTHTKMTIHYPHWVSTLITEL